MVQERRLSWVYGACLWVLLILASPEATPAPGDWPEPRQNAHLTGIQPLPGAMRSLPAVIARYDLDALAGLTGLTTLIWMGNGTSDIGGLSGSTSLETAYLDQNNIADVSPLADVENLVTLSLMYNAITDVSALGGLGSLAWLRLDYNDIASITGWTGLDSLGVLTLSHNNPHAFTQAEEDQYGHPELTGIDGLADLSSLTILYADGDEGGGAQLDSGNRVTGVATLAGTNLYYLRLENNRVASLDGLSGLTALTHLYLKNNLVNKLDALVANESFGTGDMVDLTGNPLWYTAACTQVGALRQNGATVIYPPGCTAEEDSDSDGFRDATEFDYVSLFYADPDELAAQVQNYISSGDLKPPYGDTQGDINQDFYDHTLPCVPKTRVDVDIIGQGTVCGLGTGTYYFAKYPIDCEDPCGTSVPPCSGYNQVSFTAEPAEGWVFQEWLGELPEDIGGAIDPESPDYNPGRVLQWDSDPNPDKTLSMSQDRHLVARFEHRPGIATMDLVTDLGYFFVETGVNANVDDVWDLQFDRGELRLDERLNHVYVGDGIPDAAQFYLLQAVLQDRYLDLSHRGGIAHCFAWEDYNANVTQAATDLASADGHVQRAVAAYMTLGTYRMTAMIRSMVKDHFGVDLDPMNYGRSSARYLGYREDADNNGVSNLAAWQAAAAVGLSDVRATLDAFVANALGLPQVGEGEGEGEEGEEGESQGEAGGEAGEGEGECCPNEDQIMPFTLTVTQPAGETGVAFEADVMPPGSCQQVQVLIDGSYPVKVGREICCDIKQDSDQHPFLTWYAPRSLMNGSPQCSDHFTYTGNRNLEVEVSPTARVFIKKGQYDVKGTGVGHHGAGVHPVEHDDNYPYMEFAGPTEALLALTYTTRSANQVPDGWKGTNIDGSLPDLTTGETNITVALSHITYLEPTPKLAGWPAFPMYNHKVYGGAGGLALTGVGSRQRAGRAALLGGASSPAGVGTLNIFARADVGFLFVKWNGGPPLLPLCAGFPEQRINYDIAPVCVAAQFMPAPMLFLEVTGGPGAPECIGYCSASPAAKYYSLHEVVTVGAAAQPGFYFVRWRGEGLAWLPGDDPLHDPGESLESEIQTVPEIQIRMDSNRTLEAVFTDCPCGLPSSPCVSRAAETFRDQSRIVDCASGDPRRDIGGNSELFFDSLDRANFDWAPCLRKLSNGTCVWTVQILKLRVAYNYTLCPECSFRQTAHTPVEYCEWTCINENWPKYVTETGNCDWGCTMKHEEYHCTVDLDRALPKVPPTPYFDSVTIPCGDIGANTKEWAYDAMLQAVRAAAWRWFAALKVAWADAGNPLKECGAMCAEDACVRLLTHTYDHDPQNPPDSEEPPECNGCGTYNLVLSGCGACE